MAALKTNSPGVSLPPEVASEVWAKTIGESTVMSLATKMSLPGNGQEVDLITSDPEASWKGEGEAGTVSTPGVGSKKIKPYDLNVIVAFSDEFRRDKSNLYDEIVARTPKAIGAKFDKTVYGLATKPGELFDSLAGATAVDIETDPWGGLVNADQAVSLGGGILDGWALAAQAKGMLLSARDNDGRPLFVNSTTSEKGIAALMGSAAHISKNIYKAATTTDAAQLGFAGDWSAARWGCTGDIKMSISDQATLTIDGKQVNLWENGMFAVKFDFFCGFRTKFDDQFVKLVGKTPTTSTTPSTGQDNG